jgi:hypothetical protein
MAMIAMIAIAPGPEAATVELFETPPEASRLASCPLCYTTQPSLSQDAVASGADWRCARCGQRWDARRLATVTAYAAWVVAEQATRSTWR